MILGEGSSEWKTSYGMVGKYWVDRELDSPMMTEQEPGSVPCLCMYDAGTDITGAPMIEWGFWREAPSASEEPGLEEHLMTTNWVLI